MPLYLNNFQDRPVRDSTSSRVAKTYRDPRGPLRRVMSFENTTTATLVSLECGHVATWAPHISAKHAETARCIDCLENA